MANEHLMYAEEATWGTYVPPTVAIPVTAASLAPAQPQMNNDDTGGGRARRPGGLGEKTVAGPITTKLYGLGVPALVASMYGARDVDADGTGFKNKLLPDDDVPFESFSFQKRFTDTLAESIRGAKLNGYTVGARSKEFATLETRWVAKDAAISGGQWADAEPAVAITSSSVATPTVITTASPHGFATGDRVVIAGHTGSTPAVDGTYTITVTGASTFTVPVAVSVGGTGGTATEIAPAVIDPPAYPADQPDALKFNQGVMRTGGTTALTAGEITWTGGADRCEFDNVAVEVNNNLSNDAFGVCLGDPTVQSVDEGRREVTIRFEPNFATVGGEFYRHWLESDDMTFQLYFESAQEYDTGKTYRWAWTFPLVRVTSAPTPELNAAYGLKRQTVEAMAYHDDTLGVDQGLVIHTGDDLT